MRIVAIVGRLLKNTEYQKKELEMVCDSCDAWMYCVRIGSICRKRNSHQPGQKRGR